MLITISSKYSNTYPHRRDLYNLGLRYKNHKWRINTANKQLCNEITSFCKAHKLYCECVADNYVRSNTYRKEFLAAYSKHQNKFRCAYCGKVIDEKEMTVDHIIPVRRVQQRGLIRWLMEKSGVSNVNDVANLTPSCEHCNKHKSTKINVYYYLRGMLGRTYTGAAIVHYVVMGAFAIAACLAFILMWWL